jgi:two-component system sensor histidine kinase KdpD
VRKEAAQRREMETSMLYALSRDLSFARVGGHLPSGIDNVSQTFGREVVLLLPESKGKESLKMVKKPPDFFMDDNEIAVATWSFKFGQIAGRGTDTLPESTGRYLPLKTPRGVVGVLGVKPREEGRQMTQEQRRLLETFSRQAALAIERAQLAVQAQEAQLLQATERLQTALLNSISHDLRTPLVSITGALSSLSDGGAAMDARVHQDLVDTALEEADRMNRLVGNLLNMTRLEAGAMRVTKQPGDIQDAIGTALENFDEILRERTVTVKIEEHLPLVPMDFVLIVQVLVNLIDNALKYSALESPVEIDARQVGQEICVSVNDRGIGIPEDDLEHVFEKFYRIERPEKISGTGLGLSISKGVTEAHERDPAETARSGMSITSACLAGERDAKRQTAVCESWSLTMSVIRRYSRAPSAQGITVAEASSGGEALRAGRTSGCGDFDRLLDMEGTEVTRRYASGQKCRSSSVGREQKMRR